MKVTIQLRSYNKVVALITVAKAGAVAVAWAAVGPAAEWVGAVGWEVPAGAVEFDVINSGAGSEG